MTKPLDKLTRQQIESQREKAFAASSDVTKQFIAAGRGNERGSEIRNMTDPLALKWIDVNDRLNAINDEIEQRRRYHGTTHRILRK